MQFKKIEIYGRDLEDFKPQRNPLGVTVHTLTNTEKNAMKFLIHQWMEKNEYQFLMSKEEAVELLHKLNNYIGYEQI